MCKMYYMARHACKRRNRKGLTHIRYKMLVHDLMSLGGEGIREDSLKLDLVQPVEGYFSREKC